MTPMAKRRIIDGLIHVATISSVMCFEGLVVVVVVVGYGMWNFYDGMTRLDLKD